ncbi:U3 small nucleolar ribonucleoprotein MPP10 [Heracleum sosnowskyi]|uniref:U3 small nucleolar ribonucleoprotein MPP10 n=1 Tax=Heracleum sosnowskyi TaxID=360622 RepID=A0AAD8HTL5_9APIA|nr:U3 small nucleolar ribonucleoprotein MPP10 [Heracleum sosnowskyi]
MTTTAVLNDVVPSLGNVLDRLKSTPPPQFLSPSPQLAESARSASKHIFNLIKPYAVKSPFDSLLIDGFDAEQIWQQIDLQTQGLVSSLRRDVKRFERDEGEIREFFEVEREGERVERESEERDELEMSELERETDEEEEGESEDDEERESEEDEEERESEEGDGEGVEDKFLKIKELEEYMEDDEAREYGMKKTKKKNEKVVNEEDDDEEGEEDDDDDEDDELGLLGVDVGEDDEDDIRYEDFFESQKKTAPKNKSKRDSKSDDSDSGDEDMDVLDDDNQKGKTLSTYEKQLEKQRSKIEQMEKMNLDPKTWTMQGEVTAPKRPKNSALEVDLDFEHNVRPAPVITEEVTADIEELIKKRILEGSFDDVEKAPTLPSTAPKEIKELDENKSKKGLGDIYADEYVQKTGLVSTALSFSDEQKKEASTLFKKLCLKLDALSHFQFTPKPVIEDMSIQTNVPALCIEEIAPLAISDAAMLAPEEVYSGKGDIKEEAELTQAERKRRRANKKRKFKAEEVKRTVKKPRESTLQDGEGKDKLVGRKRRIMEVDRICDGKNHGAATRNTTSVEDRVGRGSGCRNEKDDDEGGISDGRSCRRRRDEAVPHNASHNQSRSNHSETRALSPLGRSHHPGEQGQRWGQPHKVQGLKTLRTIAKRRTTVPR